MAAAILSQDLVGICLILCKGNTCMDLEKMIQKAEEFQNNNNRHFGISRSDFRCLFWMLLNWELGIKKEFNQVRLSDIISNILDYHDVYFNDEGEHWTGRDNEISDYEKCDHYYWYGYDKNEYCKKVLIKKIMKEFFKNQISPDPTIVMQFLDRLKFDDDILYQCSRSGESS
jgi:hypothetical protein